MSGYPWLIKQSVLIFSERANTNVRIAAIKATSPIQSVRTAARKRHRIKATTVMTQARLTRRRITTRCSATMMTESRICFKKRSSSVYLLDSFLFYRMLFFITDQLSVNRSRLYDALAGLVDGKATVSLPTVSLIYLLNNFSLVLPFE